ncbi:LysR family transcriptional regulator (plasmid) [Novosphingobium sp. BL-8A]|uniref:LysR family transcriptional regulator n=1 Tax=Novosphingobium sp. BL-8A TaxID=3127639 RepID=UPI0037573EF5
MFFALDAILHSRTLTEAANELHVTQPAMSVSLKKLRAYFEDELVVYSTTETRYTELAIALRPRIRATLQSARDALGLSLDFDPMTDRRTVTVTAPDIVEYVFLNEVFGAIQREAPKISFVSRPFSYQPVDQLFREPLDVAIVSEAFALPEYPSAELFSDELCCLVWEGNSRIGETMTESQYFSMRHAAIEHTHSSLSHPIGAALHHLHGRQDIAVRTAAYSTLPRLIVGGDLIITTLGRFAEMCAKTMPLRVVPCPVDTPRLSFVAQWQTYRDSEPLIVWLVEVMKRKARELAPPAAREPLPAHCM